MKIKITLLVALLLFGCSMNGIPSFVHNKAVPESVSESVVKITNVLFSGSAVRLDDDWMVTARHNKRVLFTSLKDVYYHPTCDIALYKGKGIATTTAGKVYSGGKLYHVGYPELLPLAVGEGKYLGDVTVTNRDYNCYMSVSTGEVMSGMSGGGVYNSKFELVGISTNIMQNTIVWGDGMVGKNTSGFIALYGVRDWLEEVTGIDYFKE